MKLIYASFAAMSLALISAVPLVPAAAMSGAQEQSRSDQGEARREMKAGNLLEARELENRFFRAVRKPVCRSGQSSGSGECIEYLNYDYDRVAKAYRFKYILQGRVSFMDIDARTGRVINRSR